MDNLLETVALIRRQSELQIRLQNSRGTAVATEREFEATRRRLANHPHALNAVLQTAQALRRPPETISASEVEKWECSN